MNKDAIKIIKRDKRHEAGKPKIVVATPKAESDARHGIVRAVKNWIFERSENRRAEKVFSDDKISGWQMMSENFK